MIAVFLAFLRLGLTSFGGPSAHIGYFHSEFVARRGWLSEAEFAERLALAQFLPGPASSQLGFAIGLHRTGPAGALAAFAGFTLPSAALMALAGVAAARLPESGPLAGAVEGLKLVALAIVAQAVVAMAGSLCPDRPRRIVAGLALAALVWLPFGSAQLAALAAAALLGALAPQAMVAAPEAPLPMRARGAVGLGLGWLVLCAGLLLIPFARPYLQAGALVFGGGHVVLSLLHEALGGPLEPRSFVAGYGLAQAMPGPLFTFASYLGAASGGVGGALLATAAIFAPGFALYAFALPLWARLAHIGAARGMVAAVNAAVVGVLGAAWLTQIAPYGLRGPAEIGLSAALLAAAFLTRLPPVALVTLAAGAGALLLAP